MLDLAGPVVEQRTGSLRDSALRQLRGDDDGATRLRDVIAVLDAAAKDEKMPHALLMLDDFAGAGLPTLREIAAAIERFKAAGKPVYAWGSSFDQRQYYLAAHATEVWLHPMGMVVLEGYGRYRNYYKDLLDRVGVTANVLRVGKLQELRRAFSANAPSKEALESEGALYGVAVAELDPAASRRRASCRPAASRRPSNRCPAACRPPAATRRAGRWSAKWVDGLKTRDELRALLIERGARDDDGKTFRQVSLRRYLGRVKPRQRRRRGRRDRGPGRDQRRHAAGRAASAACRPPNWCARRAKTTRSRPSCCASIPPAAAPSAANSCAANSSSRAQPASRWWCRWATWRPRAATGSRWPPTR